MKKEILSVLLMWYCYLPKDSSFVQGTISNEQGIFSINQTSGNNILRISCLGFIPVTKAYAQFPVTIVMHEDVNLLGEVVVRESPVI